MKVKVAATVLFDIEIGKQTDEQAKDWLREDIETVLDAWENGYENVNVPVITMVRLAE